MIIIIAPRPQATSPATNTTSTTTTNNNNNDTTNDNNNTNTTYPLRQQVLDLRGAGPEVRGPLGAAPSRGAYVHTYNIIVCYTIHIHICMYVIVIRL